MNSFLILSLSILSFCNISANNDSIPVERKSTSPARRIPSMSNPRDVLPRSERPFNSLPIKSKRLAQPNPQVQDIPRMSELSTQGRVAEDELANPWIYMNTSRYLNRWYRNITGFRVFFDQGATVGFGKDYNIRADTYATFGYQFNPIYYVGVGQGFSLSLNSQESSAPSFINTRINFLDENTTPFFDLKVGYSFIEGKGIYLNPNFGMSFSHKKRAWNVSAGYSFQRADVIRKGVNYKYHGVALKVSYEFGVF